jgi:hypothetical protein
MSDKINNWYSMIDKEFQRKPTLDKNYKEHYINPCSHVCCIGQTGSGKTQALLEFLKRKQDAFYNIVLFTGSTSDEPLYNFLQNKIPEMETYTDINDLPSLSHFDDEDKHQEKLIIFDDFTDLKKKDMAKINEYLKASRKFGFSCWILGQNYTSIPKTITRNCQYFIIFKQNDNVTLNNIIRNHNTENINKEAFKKAYEYATTQPNNFLLIDTTVGAGFKKLRHNFKNFIQTK